MSDFFTGEDGSLELRDAVRLDEATSNEEVVGKI